MTNDPGIILLLIIALCIPTFWIIIHYGLKQRKNLLQKQISNTDASIIISSINEKNKHYKHILYGNFIDISNSVVAFDIKDITNNNIGRVIYNIYNITIETNDHSFGIFNEGKWNFHISIRPLNGQKTLLTPIAECIGTGILNKKLRYIFPGAEEIEVRFQILGRRASIWREGYFIGEWFRLGPYELSGKAIVLREELPLLHQIILLSGPFRNKQNMPF